MAREIILDTETTGLDHRDHRVIEIGCLEVEDYIPTGRTFYKLINPDRPIDPDAERVHGIGAAMLADKPRFAEVCDELLAFIGDALVVAHNAAFDRGFINAELKRVGRDATPDHQWVCTYQLAQKRFPGMYNSLDALCRRYRVSLSEREKHGALIDARLLASVYLELQGGRERALDFTTLSVGEEIVAYERPVYGARPRPLAPRLTPEEQAAHTAFVSATLKDAAIWSRLSA
jgi:DNA polymerase-3 subunit epsilon